MSAGKKSFRAQASYYILMKYNKDSTDFLNFSTVMYTLVIDHDNIMLHF